MIRSTFVDPRRTMTPTWHQHRHRRCRGHRHPNGARPCGSDRQDEKTNLGCGGHTVVSIRGTAGGLEGWKQAGEGRRAREGMRKHMREKDGSEEPKAFCLWCPLQIRHSASRVIRLRRKFETKNSRKIREKKEEAYIGDDESSPHSLDRNDARRPRVGAPIAPLTVVSLL
jgi:hypothetical protein